MAHGLRGAGAGQALVMFESGAGGREMRRSGAGRAIGSASGADRHGSGMAGVSHALVSRGVVCEWHAGAEPCEGGSSLADLPWTWLWKVLLAPCMARCWLSDGSGTSQTWHGEYRVGTKSKYVFSLDTNPSRLYQYDLA